jgi:hypothetical protein
MSVYQESFSFLLEADTSTYGDTISHDPAADASYDLKQVTSNGNQYAMLDDEDIAVRSQITERFYELSPLNIRRSC